MSTKNTNRSRPHQVILVDPHPIVVEALTERLHATNQFEVVASLGDSDRAFFEILERQPDLVIMEIELPGRGATAVAEHIQSRLPATRLAFLTNYITDVFLDLALKIGVAGYALKTDPTNRIINGCLSIINGDQYFSERVLERLEYSPETGEYQVKSQSYLSTLTLRQLQVLRHLVRGESVKEVAKTMTLSERAIESHKYRIMQKLGIHDRVELARFAIREGLMPA
ncbi:response regulator transcription factor [Thalassoglobus sp. JC818]|uniref:response regulator transcription factor n=1 Tax=Thalassoglobus sp. JC818 TaxID=3232136 RepID=UPI0034597C57